MCQNLKAEIFLKQYIHGIMNNKVQINDLF